MGKRAPWADIAQKKFDDGEWKPTPWHNEPWFIEGEKTNQHFTHISVRDSDLVAHVIDYSEDKDKMRIVSGRAGRYLRKFYDNVLSDGDIRSWSTKLAIESGDIEILYAADPDEIEHVYTHGPNSCMSRDADYYKAKIHPCRIYGAGDLAVAYLKNKNGRIISRSVCWPEKRVFSSIYGDGGNYDDVLRNHLTLEKGWSQDHYGLNGAKCLKIDYKKGFVAPYIDGMLGLKVHSDHLIIQSGGYDFRAGSESGALGYCCDDCEDELEDEDEGYEWNGGTYCSDCWSLYAFNCNECCDESDREHGHSIDDWGTMVCDYCHSRYFAACDECGVNVRIEEVMESPDGRDFCDSCYSDNVDFCDFCNTDTMPEDMKESDIDRERRCESCHDEHLEDYDKCNRCDDTVEITELSEGICGGCEENLELEATG